MNETVLNVLIISALVVSDVLLVVFGVLWYRSRMAARQEAAAPAAAEAREVSAEPAEDEALEGLRQEVRALSLNMNLLAERVARAEKLAERLQQREVAPAPAEPGSGTERRSFELAAKLAAKGADVEEIVSLCGLTRGEAELIRMMHGAGGPSRGGQEALE